MQRGELDAAVPNVPQRRTAGVALADGHAVLPGQVDGRGVRGVHAEVAGVEPFRHPGGAGAAETGTHV